MVLSSKADEIVIKQYHDYKQQLENVYTYIAEGIILRSWREIYKLFLQPTKQNKAKFQIRTIILKDGNETDNSNIILSNSKSFFVSLYKRQCQNRKGMSELLWAM